MRILHLLYQSYPNISGSSTRSRSIINSQKELGLFPIVLTSPFQAGLKLDNGIETIDSVTYYRCFNGNKNNYIGEKKSFLSRIVKLFSIVRYFFIILKVARHEKVNVIHSHAMFYNAIPGILVSRIIGVPHVYEIRSDWSQNSNFSANKLTKTLLGLIEKIAIKMSNSVVVISEGLYAKYSKLNNQTYIIGNAVDNKLIIQNRDKESSFFSKPIRVGYIGSIIPLEGLEYVLEALKFFDKSQIKFSLVGAGSSLQDLKNMAKNFDFDDDFVDFKGKVKPEDIADIYNQLDIIINYRRDEPVAHSVTPLKPLEAMAYKKLILVSSVGGMTELVTNMENGIVVENNNPEALAKTLANILESPGEYQYLREAGYNFVKNNKVWQENAKKYASIYQKKSI